MKNASTKSVEKSEEQLASPPIRNRYYHDYNFAFSNQIIDCLYSSKRANEDGRKKERLKIKESDW